MYQYRQALTRMRQGDSDRDLARSGLMGRKKASAFRELAERQSWLARETPLPEDVQIAEVLARQTVLGSSGRPGIARCTPDCLSCSSSRPDEKNASNKPAKETIRSDFGRVMMAAQMDTVMSSNAWYVPSAWNTKWSNLTRRAEVRHRPPYQTRHTYACWNLTARGNLAFIANQMGHSDYSMLVKVYGRWIDSESPRELGRIWQGMKKLVQIAPNLPQ